MIPIPSVTWYLVTRLTQYASWHMALSVEVTENNRQMRHDRMQESPFFRGWRQGWKCGKVKKNDVSVIKEPITGRKTQLREESSRGKKPKPKAGGNVKQRQLRAAW
eukprot:scaffold83468_cov53-Attheya_sp.AAC.1